MNPQQKEFDTALTGLTPEQKTAYTKANPTVGVGGVQQTFNLPTGNYMPTSNVMTGNNLGTTPTPYNLPSANTQPTTGNLAMATNSAVGGITTDANYTPPPVDTAKVGSQKLLQDLGINIQNQANDIATINNDAQLLEKKQKATKISTEVDMMDKAYRDEVAQVKQTFKGTTGGLQDEINRITDRYQNNRANLALTYKVATEDYNGAQEIANQKVQSLKDTNLAKLELYKLNVDAINNDLTESEKIQVQANIQAKQKQADTINNAYADVLKNLSTSGQNVPASVYSAVDAAARKPNATSADIYAAAGQYGQKTDTSVVEVNGRKLLIDSMGNTVKDLGTTGGGSTTPTIKSINGVDMQYNSSTGKWETPTVATSDTGVSSKTMPLAQAQANVESITGLVNDPMIRSAVGPTGLARLIGRGLDTLTGGRQNFIGSVEQIRSNLNLEALIGAKARGATFGALSDQELQVLASSASKIGSWAMKDKNGQVTGYNASEKDFKKELDKINNFAKLDYIIKGGDPMNVGAQMQSDGTIWTNNSDGTFTQIK